MALSVGFGFVAREVVFVGVLFLETVPCMADGFKHSGFVVGVLGRDAVGECLFHEAAQGVVGVGYGAAGGGQCGELAFFVVGVGGLLAVGVGEAQFFVHVAPFIGDGVSGGVCHGGHSAKGVCEDVGYVVVFAGFFESAEGVVGVV